jgi:ATP-dependent Clp protease, protease subunit
MDAVRQDGDRRRDGASWQGGSPPEVPFPERPGPTRPIFPSEPERPGPRPSPSPGPAIPLLPPGLLSPQGDMRSRVYDDLLQRRMVVLDRALDDEAATLVAAQLVALDQAGGEPITLLVVNSAGGPMAAASAVLDTMDLVRAPVGTMCVGRAEGTAVVVAATGTGRRRIGAGARLRLRLADLDLRGPAQRLDHELAYHRELQATLVDRLAAVTGQEPRLVERDVDAGRAFTAAEAIAYGLADEIVGAPRG